MSCSKKPPDHAVKWHDPLTASQRQRLAPLPATFYRRPTAAVAQDLLGCLLVRHLGRQWLIGRIVEVEAYGGADDPASHAFRGPTRRNRSMFGSAGRAYVYFTYGNHYCLNVVCEKNGVPGAVLIRALEPLCGLAKMARRRRVDRLRELCSGPGKICQALQIDRREDGIPLFRGALRLCSPLERKDQSVLRSPRIGISQAQTALLRFSLAGSPFLSRPARRPQGS